MWIYTPEICKEMCARFGDVSGGELASHHRFLTNEYTSVA